MLHCKLLFIIGSSLATNCFKATKKISILSQKLFLIAALVVNLSSVSQSQKFLLTDINSTHFSIDRIAQQVYFKDFYSNTVRKVDLKNLEVTNTGLLVLLPIFSNKQHLMLYGNNSLYDHGNKNNYYLYNLDKQSKFIITDTLSYPPDVENYYSFSPNDSNFIAIGGMHYFSLKDSSLLPLDIEINYDQQIDAYPQWSSDTSFVFLSGDNVIAEFFLKSRKLDTLVSLANYTNFLGFAYNNKHNILAYSTTKKQIYFHYKDTNRDSLIFYPVRDDPDEDFCWNFGAKGITSLSWSPDNKELAFLGFQFIDISVAGIYIYSLDSNRTYNATDCNDDGRKYSLKWVNNDTLIYSNSTDKFLYGIDVSSVITSVEQKKNNEVVTDFTISNYPNPFNNSTKIFVTMPNNTTGTLFIYDSLGEVVKKYYLKDNGKNNYEIIWDGSNDNNKSVSSGFYFGVVKSNDLKVKNTKTIKMIYLK